MNKESSLSRIGVLVIIEGIFLNQGLLEALGAAQGFWFTARLRDGLRFAYVHTPKQSACDNRGPKDHINIKIPNSRSKAQDKGDSRKYGL